MRKTTYGSSKILKLKSLPLDMAATLGRIMCWVCQRFFFFFFLGGKCKANYRQIWWMSSCDWNPVTKHGHMAHAGLFASSTQCLMLAKTVVKDPEGPASNVTCYTWMGRGPHAKPFPFTSGCGLHALGPMVDEECLYLGLWWSIRFLAHPDILAKWFYIFFLFFP